MERTEWYGELVGMEQDGEVGNDTWWLLVRVPGIRERRGFRAALPVAVECARRWGKHIGDHVRLTLDVDLGHDEDERQEP
jgi:hypothetical protein